MPSNSSVHAGGPALPKDIPASFREAETFYKVDLQALNDSGITGEVLLAIDEDTGQLTVVVSADGLEANQIHIQHIHGFADDGDPATPRIQATIPDASDDADRDGYIELLEGVPDYGPILLNVALNHEDGTGGDNGHSHDAGALSGFPTAPDWTIRFSETYQLPTTQGLVADTDFTLYHFVIHGMSAPAGAGAGTGGEVDGTAGYKLILPVAIGAIEEISASQASRELGEMRSEFALDAAARRADRMDDGSGSDLLFA